MKKNAEVSVDHVNDLRSILEKYNLAEKIDKRELKCAHCNKVITWDNISALRADGSNFILYCDDTGCIETVSNS